MPAGASAEREAHARHQRAGAAVSHDVGVGPHARWQGSPRETEKRLRPCQRAQARSAQRTRGISERGWGPARNKIMPSRDLSFRLGTGLFGLALILIVAAIGFELTRQSMLSIQKFGLNFWRTQTWDPVAGEFGALPFIWGTLYSSMLALALATPVALGIAVFLSELCPAWLKQPLVFVTELLAAIPSIVYGLWGIFVLVPMVRLLETSTPQALRHLPLFTGPPLGVGMLSAGLTLAVLLVPFTSSVAREVLKAVPVAQREAAYALGATRFEAIRAALFYARTGIIGAVMLGFGRALGETMAVTMVIGNDPKVTWSLFAPQYTMAAVLANEFSEAADPLHVSALVEIGLVLFTITLIVNILSRLLIWSMARSARGPALVTVAEVAAA